MFIVVWFDGDHCCSRDVLKCCIVESWAAHANDKNGVTHETRIAALTFVVALEEIKGDGNV